MCLGYIHSILGYFMTMHGLLHHLLTLPRARRPQEYQVLQSGGSNRKKMGARRSNIEQRPSVLASCQRPTPCGRLKM